MRRKKEKGEKGEKDGEKMEEKGKEKGKAEPLGGAIEDESICLFDDE